MGHGLSPARNYPKRSDFGVWCRANPDGLLVLEWHEDGVVRVVVGSGGLEQVEDLISITELASESCGFFVVYRLLLRGWERPTSVSQLHSGFPPTSAPLR